jgi:hypothetical protein
MDTKLCICTDITETGVYNHKWTGPGAGDEDETAIYLR